MSEPSAELAPSDPEDVKIITLARSAQARTAATAGACLRDSDGRTYAASAVQLPHLQLSAVAVAVAMAVSSGAQGVEAVALAGSEGPSGRDLDLLGDLPGAGVVLWHVDPHGRVQQKVALDDAR